jgi:predicted KAP-like P-loop ATPase
VFDAERPITHATQDRLDRSVFAKYLARCMLDHKDPESLVIGLYGGWGVGKTSVINLIVEELNFAATNVPEDETPIVLNFSPWSYSGQNQLIYSFFRRLSSVLRSVPHLENKDRIIYLLELYVSYFTHLPVPNSLRKKHSLLDKILFKKDEEIYGWESGRDLTLIKSELNELLKQQKHKIIIIIDNISRLYDYEIKQIFQIHGRLRQYRLLACS